MTAALSGGGDTPLVVVEGPEWRAHHPREDDDDDAGGVQMRAVLEREPDELGRDVLEHAVVGGLGHNVLEHAVVGELGHDHAVGELEHDVPWGHGLE